MKSGSGTTFTILNANCGDARVHNRDLILALCLSAKGKGEQRPTWLSRKLEQSEQVIPSSL